MYIYGILHSDFTALCTDLGRSDISDAAEIVAGVECTCQAVWKHTDRKQVLTFSSACE